jgi:lipopolysaccharide/colanic/teichoic acid biosynthesis glycosyltransferase
MGYSIIKRLFDVISSFFGLIFFSPLFLIVAVLIKLDSKGPVFYRGVRAGKDGKPFRIFKFRTMVHNAEKIGGPSTSADDPRLTRVGKIIRNLKIDEFPQMINILKGQMSFVGPRPEVLDEVETYSEKEKRILSVMPGMVDYATTKFHNEEVILEGADDPHQAYKEKIQPEKLKLALEYVDNRSLWVDLNVLLTFISTLITTRLGNES